MADPYRFNRALQREYNSKASVPHVADFREGRHAGEQGRDITQPPRHKHIVVDTPQALKTGTLDREGLPPNDPKLKEEALKRAIDRRLEDMHAQVSINAGLEHHTSKRQWHG